MSDLYFLYVLAFLICPRVKKMIDLCTFSSLLFCGHFLNENFLSFISQVGVAGECAQAHAGSMLLAFFIIFAIIKIMPMRWWYTNPFFSFTFLNYKDLLLFREKEHTDQTYSDSIIHSQLQTFLFQWCIYSFLAMCIYHFLRFLTTTATSIY